MARTEELHGYQPHPDDAAVAREAAAVAAMQPVPVSGTVSVHGSLKTRGQAATYGAYYSVVLAGTEAAQQVLPYDEHRKTAYLTLSGTGPVYAGTEAQCRANQGGLPVKLGFLLATGVTLTVTHQQPVWLIPDGTHSATLSVAIERWES